MARNLKPTGQSVFASIPGGLASYNGALSCFAWVNPSAVSATVNITALYCCDSGFGARGFFMNTGAASNQTKWSAVTCGTSIVLGNSNLAINAWSHIGFTLPSGTSTLQLYLNGVADNSATATLVGVNAGDISGTYSGHVLGGSVFDVAVWKAVLTAAEVAALANGARPNTVRPASLVIWMPFDGIESPEPNLANVSPLFGTLSGVVGIAPGPPVMPFTSRWPQNNLQKFAPAYAINRGAIVDALVS